MSSKIPLMATKLLKWSFGQEKFLVSLLIIIIIIASATHAVDAVILQILTDIIESANDSNAHDIINIALKWAFIYALWWEMLNILWRSYDYVYLRAMPRIKSNIIDELYNYTQQHDHYFFQKEMSGDVGSRILEGARSFELIFAYLNEKILRKLFMLIFVLMTLYNVHYQVANIFLLWFICFLSISLYFARPFHILSMKYSKDRAHITGRIVDALSNISVIRMFVSYKFEQNHLRKSLDTLCESDKRMQFFMLKVRYLLGFSCSVMIGIMLYYLINLRSELQITIGQCVLVVTLCISVVTDVWDLIEEFGELFESMGSLSQTLTLLEDYNMQDNVGSKEVQFIKPKIEFDNVTFFYKGNDNIFNNQSVIIEPGQKVGLAGFSGSGKTTFTNLITRLFNLDNGRILINNIDITTINQNSLRRNISVIPQEPILFNRTIMENIRYGNQEASDDEVIEAAKASYIHEVISLLPYGYDTICGERGNNLSGGQRQRIVIARAILKNAPILILDEATSALDGHTENLIQQSLNNLMQDKTVIVIAHRLSTLLDMDRILVFEAGHIVEDGDHKTLKDSGKVYQKLWRSQII